MAANTAIGSAPLVPEIRLHLASEITPIWRATEAWLERSGVDPPYWAFAWPGGQALARYILDNPALVRGKHVLDFAAGCGIAAIACALAGAAQVDAAEVDPVAAAAIGANAALNGAKVNALTSDLVGCDGDWTLIVCGDVCYEARMTGAILPWLQQLSSTRAVWLADPGRAYLPAHGIRPIAGYEVATSLELEDRTMRVVTIYTVLPS